MNDLFSKYTRAVTSLAGYCTHFGVDDSDSEVFIEFIKECDVQKSLVPDEILEIIPSCSTPLMFRSNEVNIKLRLIKLSGASANKFFTLRPEVIESEVEELIKSGYLKITFRDTRDDFKLCCNSIFLEKIIPYPLPAKTRTVKQILKRIKVEKKEAKNIS